MSERSKRRQGYLGVLAAVVVLVAASCGAGGRPEGDQGQAPSPGVTAESVKVGGHFPLTGVAAPGYSEIPTGAKAYFDYVNANGGVNGRTIDYVFKDDAYNPTNTSQVVNELVLQDEVFAMVGGLGTATHSAVLDSLNSQGVPDLFVSSGSLLWDQPQKNRQTFGWQPDYEVEGKIIGQYVQQNFPGAKVGLFAQDDDFGEDGEKGVRTYIDKQIVAVERYVPGNTDVAPQISALQASGADLVIGFNVPSYTALSQLTSLRLNYDPQWIYSNVGSDPALVGSLLSQFSKGQVNDASLLDSAITTEYLPGVDEVDNPWTRLWQQVWEAHGDGAGLTNFRIYGMSQAYTFVQALQAAGPEPTREGMVQALEKVGGQFAGPGMAPFRYSAESHAGIAGVKVVRLRGVTAEDLTPVLVTDNGDAPITEKPGEHAPPPPNGIPQVPPAG
ncbi:amino acid-binding protein [Amycolatopsis antarctica]|uniref:Amino acid-binding protein n=1 Tax=Amycolatopsis antarctica TaxID=1854586 RepID=A0A263D6Q2_9PSEU|nr:ABC transporter substrate-binding protein [Amycolatopsis antarctica]OZM74140.1 amino acid-binding protein [Amycolatopsis antarctica]